MTMSCSGEKLEGRMFTQENL